MRCEQVKRLFTDYAEGDLPERERKAVSRHLEQCAKCARELRAFDHAVVAVRSLPTAEPPAHLRERIREAIYAAAAEAPSVGEARALRKAGRPVWLGAAVGGVAAAAVLAIVVALQQPHGGTARLAQRGEGVAPTDEARVPEPGRLAGGATYEPAEAPSEAAAPPAEVTDRPAGSAPEPAAEEARPLYASRELAPSGRFRASAEELEGPGKADDVVASLTVTPLRGSGAAYRVALKTEVAAAESIPDANVSLQIREGDLDARKVDLYEGTLVQGQARQFVYEWTPGESSFAAQVEVTRGGGARTVARSEEVRVPAKTRMGQVYGAQPQAGDRVGEEVVGTVLHEDGEPGAADHVAQAGPQPPTPAAPGRASSGAEGDVVAPAMGPPSSAASVLQVRKLIDVSFRNERLHDALQEVGKQAGAKVTIDEKVPNPKVNYQAQQVAVPLVFGVLAGKGNAKAVLKADTWHIAPKGPAGESSKE